MKLVSNIEELRMMFCLQDWFMQLLLAYILAMFSSPKPKALSKLRVRQSVLHRPSTISKDFSEIAVPIWIKFQVEHQVNGGMKVCSNDPKPPVKITASSKIAKYLKKIIFVSYRARGIRLLFCWKRKAPLLMFKSFASNNIRPPKIRESNKKIMEISFLSYFNMYWFWVKYENYKKYHYSSVKINYSKMYI